MPGKGGQLKDSLVEGYDNTLKPALGGIADGIGTLFTSQAGNPWMQGVTGIIAFMLAWKFTPKLFPSLYSSDAPGAGLARAGTAIAVSSAVAFGTAAFTGTFRDDPHFEASRSNDEYGIAATQHESLQVPAQPLPTDSTDIFAAPKTS